jgi:hypothetical protein
MIVAVTAVIGVAVGLVVARLAGDVVVLVYVLVLGALLLVRLVRGLRSILPPAVRFERLLARPDPQTDEVEQFRTVERDVRLSMSSGQSAQLRLGPMVREIVSVRLWRRHGVDLDREPERAEALVGAGRTWDVIRPDREAPGDGLSRGWSRRDIEQLIDELERI